ncbi:MAG: ATP-binding cassette domain-containing protein, partial [Planctomycetota bacterium]
MIDPHDEPQPPHDGMGDEEPDAPDLPFDLAADADASVGEGDATDPALKPPPAPPETGVHPAIADSSTGASIDRALDAVVVHHPPPFATIEAAEAAVEAADAHPDPLPPHEESGIVVPFLPDERPPIQMIDLTVTVHGRTLIRNANIGIGHGEVVLLVGGSGTGKSVLSKILLGLITRDTPGFVITGRLLVHGRDILSGNLRETRRFGIVFQDYALFDELTPGENLDFAFDHSPVKWLPHERDRRLKRLTETLSLNLDTPISQSSGGERRRLAIARTLAYDPEIVLYDEPTTGLDPLNSERVAQLIGTSSRQFGKTCFVITHDYEYLRGVADRVLLLDPETRELVELDKEKATAGFVRDRLQSLAPPSTPQVSPVRKLARRVAGFFIGTSRVIEQAEGLPRSMLTWPFTIGLAVIGAVALAVLMMRGAAAAVVEPPVSIGLTGAFALGAALMLVARLRESRRHGLTSLLWLGVLVLGAMTVHGALAPMFGRDLLARASIAARNMPLELVGQFGANATTMFLMTVVPALWSLSQITRWRHAMTALSLIGATTMAFVLVSAGVSSLSQPKLVSSFALDVPSF